MLGRQHWMDRFSGLVPRLDELVSVVDCMVNFDPEETSPKALTNPYGMTATIPLTMTMHDNQVF
jgi:hypothetical protein